MFICYSHFSTSKCGLLGNFIPQQAQYILNSHMESSIQNKMDVLERSSDGELLLDPMTFRSQCLQQCLHYGYQGPDYFNIYIGRHLDRKQNRLGSKHSDNEWHVGV